MSSVWNPAQTELRTKLLEELSYVTGEAVGGRVSAECTLRVLAALDELGWEKGAPLELPDVIPVRPPTGLQCGMCIQDKVNFEAIGKDPLPVNPATTIIGGNAVCNVAGRHQVVAQQTAALLHPGELPPGYRRGGGPGRRAG